MKRQWLSLVALCALTACADDDRINTPPDHGSGGESSSGGSTSSGGQSSGGSTSSGGQSSGGASSGGSSSGGASSGGASSGGASPSDPDGGAFVSQLPRPLQLPRPPQGRLPTDLLPPEI